MDSELCYKNYIKKVFYKKLKIALTLKYIWVLTLSTARQLFSIIIAPVVNYILLV